MLESQTEELQKKLAKLEESNSILKLENKELILKSKNAVK